MAAYNFIDITGQAFGRLTVTGRAPNKKGRTFWKCACECGNTCEVRGEHLKNGATESCGCYSKESHTKHGKSRSSEYKTWQSMKERCSKPHHTDYKNYGGRGIMVCAEWNDSFSAFFADMGERPKGLTLDRINNDGHYCAFNCQWATRRDQVNNRRNSILHTIGNETKCLKDWCRHFSKSYATIRYRISKGMSIDDALAK